MPEEQFGSTLWKNAHAVTFGRDGALELPVRANGRDGIVVGVGRVTAGDAATPADVPDPAPQRSRGWLARLTRR